MAYVINVPNHEMPYGELLTRIFEAFHVPLNYKKGEDPKSGEHRRRDNEEAAPAENEEVNVEEGVQQVSDWEAVIDEAALQGESGLGEKFYDAEDEIQESAAVVEEVPEVAAQASAEQKEIEAAGVDPSIPSGSIPHFV
ncbi:hypothetical protein Dimus_013109, partial [Dionaea muscipula]